MTEKEVERLIENQTIRLPNAGIDRFPGTLIILDDDELIIDGKGTRMNVFAWYDHDKKKRQQVADNYIIEYQYFFIIVDYFFEAVAVWQYLKKKYNDDCE